MTRTFKDIEYTLVRSRRKTASIYIERDGKVSILVPENLPPGRLKICWKASENGFTRIWPSGRI